MTNFRWIGGAASDRGGYREKNEDSLLLHLIGKQEQFALGIICDGIGGLAQGELASSCITEGADAWVQSLSSWINTHDCEPDVLYAHLYDAVEEWNEQLCDLLEKEQLCSGTTMSCLLLAGGKRYTIHVGDSRIYRYTPSEGMVQLTTDSVVSRMENGKLRNFLDNYMGKGRALWCSTSVGEYALGELYLFCSDGFYNMLNESDVEQIYNQVVQISQKQISANGDSLTSICLTWMKEMIQRGEKDNLSLGLLYCAPQSAPKKKMRWWMWGLLVLVVLGIVAVVFGDSIVAAVMDMFSSADAPKGSFPGVCFPKL